MNNHDPLAKDFRNFLYVIWKHLNLPDPTPVQYDIAHFLQDGPNKICIEAFRGVGKSFITAAYVLWELYKDPKMKIMVVSASKNRSDQFTTFCLQLIDTVPELKHLQPTPDQRRSRVEFDVAGAGADQTPSVFAKGIDSQLTGGRADIIVADDTEVVNNSLTVEMRDKLKEKTKEFSAILKPLPHARTIYLGTPQTQESIYNELPSTFTKRIWTALIPTQEQLPAYGGDLAPMLQERFNKGEYGMPSDPDRFDSEELNERFAEYGAAGFQLQFMLNTQLSDEERFPLKLKNIIVSDINLDEAPVNIRWLPNEKYWLKKLPHYGMAGDKWYAADSIGEMWKPYTGRVMAIDPSGRGQDETSFAVGLELAGNIWIPKAGGFTGGYEGKTLEKLALIAKEHKVNEVIIESNFGDGMFTEMFKQVLLKVNHRCNVEEVRHSSMKEHRIVDTLEPVVSRHRLVVSPEVIQEDHRTIQGYEPLHRASRSLFHQMTHICREKGALRKDDRVDALAILVSRFTEIMSQDQDKKERDEYDKWLKDQLKSHTDAIKMTLGKKKTKKRFRARG